MESLDINLADIIISIGTLAVGIILGQALNAYSKRKAIESIKN